MVEEYFEMLNKYEKGEIDATEWTLYCIAVLKDLMFLHRDLLKTLDK